MEVILLTWYLTLHDTKGIREDTTTFTLPIHMFKRYTWKRLQMALKWGHLIAFSFDLVLFDWGELVDIAKTAKQTTIWEGIYQLSIQFMINHRIFVTKNYILIYRMELSPLWLCLIEWLSRLLISFVRFRELK